MYIHNYIKYRFCVYVYIYIYTHVYLNLYFISESGLAPNFKLGPPSGLGGSRFTDADGGS